MTAIDDAEALIETLAPQGGPVPIRTPLREDESEWFLRAVSSDVFTFETCSSSCSRFKKWGVAGPDHFVTAAGKDRHLFSNPVADTAWLNREYVPHIAAYAFLILDRGYDRAMSSFSRYRSFGQDLILKRAGTTYETDAEFYDSSGAIHLQVEAKASAAQTTTLARGIAAHGEFRGLPTSAVKEVEYLLDLAPRFLWVVGPGSVSPPKHVFAVRRLDGLNAELQLLNDLPAPPG